MKCYYLALLLLVFSCKNETPPSPEPQEPDYQGLVGTYSGEQVLQEIWVTYETNDSLPSEGVYDTLVTRVNVSAEVTMEFPESGGGQLSWDITSRSEYFHDPMNFNLRQPGEEEPEDLYSDEVGYRYDANHLFRIDFPFGTDSMYVQQLWEDLFGHGYAGPGDSLPRLIVEDYRLEATF